MNRSLPIPKVPFLRNRQPSLAELENLLDYFPHASLLLDLEKNSIVLANARATELTAYTRAELIDSDIGDLLPFLINHIQEFSTSSKSEIYIDKLATRQGSSIEVRVELAHLDPQSSWGLVICEPSGLREQASAERRRSSERLSDLSALVRASQEKDMESALQLVLKVGQLLTGANILALYLAHPSHPGLERKFTRGTQDIIPESVKPDEIEVFLKATTWEPGNRVSNLFFRAARVAKMGYLQTYPLVEGEAFIGLLILAAEQGGIPEDNSMLANILSTTITGIIQQNSMIESFLAGERSVQHDLLVGDTVKESTQDGIILLSSDLVIEELNPQAEVLLGYATSEIYGQPV
ncbi:MAG: PAS domain-containing protein, partial [Anaerolineales bacterium]